MFINLNELDLYKLQHVAIWMNSNRPPNRFEVRSGGMVSGSAGWVNMLVGEWGYVYQFKTLDGVRYSQLGTSIEVRDFNRGIQFETEPTYIRNNIGWDDVARVVLAAEQKSFWVDLPDDLCEKLEGLCT